MITYEFLIVISFIQLVVGNQGSNLTDELYPVCPVQYFRRKRAPVDYTRWHANLETTNEFLVKVLDEDFTTAPIVAVNIQQVTKGVDRIIIGGVNIPSPTTLKSTYTEPKDYTRFVPPTTLSGRDTSFHFAAVMHNTAGNAIMRILQPQGYHSQRDDSPPASPQFIARTPIMVARQYAPIEAVAFNRRTSVPPLTPQIRTLFHTLTPPHLTPADEPTRTIPNLDSLREFEPFEETVTLNYITRTSYITPERTTELRFSSATDIDREFESTSNRLFKDSRRSEEIKKVIEKDFESIYNMMFYNDDETVDSKKDQPEVDSDYVKKGNSNVGSDSEQNEFSEGEENRNDTNKKYLEGYVDDSDFVNTTDKFPSSHIHNIEGNEIATDRRLKAKVRDKRRPFCSLLKLRELSFNSPRTLPEIVKQMKTWADEKPVAKWMDITDGNYTTMENPIYMMVVDDPSSGQIVTAKQTVMIVAGIQGRDHHAVAAAMYVLYQLIERSESHTDLLTKYRFWIIPVFNPDGYDYSMTFPHRREWTKNLHQEWDACNGRESCKSCDSHGLKCTMQPCYGVNLDRNFEYQWIAAEELRAEHPCGDLYAGLRQLSEAETHALTLFLHEQRTPPFTFIAFKEGDILGIMYPYSHTKKKRAFDHVYRQRASRAASAAYSISHRPYVAGQTSEFLPLYAGGIEDWVDGHLGIDNTYTIMMFRPSDSYNLKRITERVVHETYAAMATLLLESLESLGPAPVVKITASSDCSKTLSNMLFYIATAYYSILLNK